MPCSAAGAFALSAARHWRRGARRRCSTGSTAWCWRAAATWIPAPTGPSLTLRRSGPGPSATVRTGSPPRALEREMPGAGGLPRHAELNVRGGTLDQHLPDAIELHRHTPGTFADHEVRARARSLAARAVGRRAHRVKSAHHQGIDSSVRASSSAAPPTTAWSRRSSCRTGLRGRVLWHPEEDERSRVIGSLVSEARARRRGALREGG